jgi:hypothetical protein
MSIEKKIAEMLAESQKLQVSISEEQNADNARNDVREPTAPTTKKGDVKSNASAPESSNLKSVKEEDETVQDEELVEEEIVEDEVITEKQEREITVDVSEDVAALINGEELSEEFKTKAATIFEAAVVTRVKQEVATLEEEFESKLAEQVESFKEGLVEKVDGYLNYMVEQWIADNELALESGIKSEIMEDFMEKIKVAFQESYIEIPEDRFDVLADMEEKLQSIESKLDETVAKNVELTKVINESARQTTIDAYVKGMADTEVEKFKSLAEELAYDDEESFKSKLQTIRENYFTKKATSDVKSVVTDSAVEDLTEEKIVDPSVKQYLTAFNSIKK